MGAFSVNKDISCSGSGDFLVASHPRTDQIQCCCLLATNSTGKSPGLAKPSKKVGDFQSFLLLIYFQILFFIPCIQHLLSPAWILGTSGFPTAYPGQVLHYKSQETLPLAKNAGKCRPATFKATESSPPSQISLQISANVNLPWTDQFAKGLEIHPLIFNPRITGTSESAFK